MCTIASGSGGSMLTAVGFVILLVVIL